MQEGISTVNIPSDYYSNINTLNQNSADAIRAIDGSNFSSWLLIPDYNTEDHIQYPFRNIQR